MSDAADNATLRDLGFRPYVGARHAPSRNTWVLFRYGLVRAWASLLVKLALLLAWGPPVVALAAFGIFSYLAAQNPGALVPPDLATYAGRVLSAELWLFVTAIGLGAGSTSVADDRARGAFVFYFTKPVLPRHYLAGRVLSISALMTSVLALPTTIFALAALALRKTEVGGADARLVAAIWLVAVLGASAAASVAVAVSSAFASRTIAAFTFAALWIVPHLGSLLASVVSGAPWLEFLSVPALVSILAEATFSSAGEASPVHGVIAVCALVALGAGALVFAHERIGRASEAP